MSLPFLQCFGSVFDDLLDPVLGYLKKSKKVKLNCPQLFPTVKEHTGTGNQCEDVFSSPWPFFGMVPVGTGT